jgi:hypothetical protein
VRGVLGGAGQPDEQGHQLVGGEVRTDRAAALGDYADHLNFAAAGRLDELAGAFARS